MSSCLRNLAIASIAALVPAVRAQPTNLPSTPASVAIVDSISDYLASRRALASFYGVAFDPASFDRLERLTHEQLDRLGAVPFDSLDQGGKVDDLLFRTMLEAELDEAAASRQHLDEMGPLMPFADAVAGLERDRAAMRPLSYAKAAETLSAIKPEIDALRARIEKGRNDANTDDDRLVVSPVLANRTAGMVRQVSRVLSHWFDHYNGFEPEFAWWVQSPMQEARKAIDDYAGYLTADVAGIHGNDDDPMIGDPIGREKLLADLRAEWIPYSPEELLAIADEQFAWCEQEMLRASREMGLGDDWHAALEKVKQDYVPPGEQDDLIRDIAREAIDFVKTNDLVTLPPLCEELWRVEMIPADNQRFWPFAYYGGNHVGVAYPNESMTNADKIMSMRGNNRHFTRLVTPHELIPGHHLQGFVAQRERAYRDAFSTPFLIEGWALYWEMEFWDKGWAKTPEDRIGMLFWRMHRCARIIVSLKFHLGEMTPQEMVDFLVDRVGHERFGAASEVRRYIGGQYSPLYQCAYMIGGLQLRALRHELVDSGAMSEKAFHDGVLAQGPIPIELIRASMAKQQLSPNTRTSWRFGQP
ncbi:MAG: DUF885 family protein [Phycisphaerales bacterium]|nr:DUF885 family protein [Phycisphaerales bacterium]